MGWPASRFTGLRRCCQSLGRAREAAGHYEDGLSGQMNGNFVYLLFHFPEAYLMIFSQVLILFLAHF
jgi:hypothetical protein